MWSRKFAIAGLLSAAILAALSVVAIGSALQFALGLIMQSSNFRPEVSDFFKITAWVAVGVFVYPACWFFMIQRGRDYGATRMHSLVWTTYGISCVAVVVTFCVFGLAVYGTIFSVGVLRMISGSIEPSLHALMYGLILIVVTPVAALLGIGIGALVILPFFIVMAIPIAYLHRWLLLRMFAPG